MEEGEYRRKIRELFDRLENAFEAVDPDVAECEQSQGSLTIRLADGSRCILSAQPSVRQLWMAVASQGIAFHFDYDAAQNTWKDDKGKGVEPMTFLKQHLKDSTGLDLSF